MEVLDEMASGTLAEPVPVVETNQIDQDVEEDQEGLPETDQENPSEERRKNSSKDKWRRLPRIYLPREGKTNLSRGVRKILLRVQFHLRVSFSY
ncbi:hypothetical protein YC2023_065719 [Brassica napus]